jgi:hypothetical protein
MGIKRPGLGALALCLFVICFSLARLCPLFTPSSPEQTSTLAGVPSSQAPFYTMDAGKFLSSHSHFILPFCWDCHHSSHTSTYSFCSPGGIVISSAGVVSRTQHRSVTAIPSERVAFWQPCFELFERKML